MGILIENKTTNTTKTYNTGISKEILEGATVRYALSKSDFTFDTKEDINDMSKWKEAIKNKDIVPFFSIEANLENTNTEPTYYESRTLKVKTKEARKGKKGSHHLGLYSHAALKSYEDSNYNRVFEFTEDGYIKSVFTQDGKIAGQELSSFNVSIRNKEDTGTAPRSSRYCCNALLTSSFNYTVSWKIGGKFCRYTYRPHTWPTTAMRDAEGFM